MDLKKLFVVLSFVIAGVSFGFSQKDAVVWSNTTSDLANLSVGDTVRLYFKADIKDGYFIYSTRPYDAGGPVNTTIKLKELSGCRPVSELMEDDDSLKSVFDRYFQYHLYYFEDEALFFTDVIITDPKIELKGHLQLMVCNEEKQIPGYNDFHYIIYADDPENTNTASGNLIK